MQRHGAWNTLTVTTYQRRLSNGIRLYLTLSYPAINMLELLDLDHLASNFSNVVDYGFTFNLGPAIERNRQFSARSPNLIVLSFAACFFAPYSNRTSEEIL